MLTARLPVTPAPEMPNPQGAPPWRALARFPAATMLAMACALCGCASLPVSGPTGSQVARAARDGRQPAQFQLVELDRAAALPAPVAQPPVLRPRLPPPPTDTIGPGDVLDIVVYEAGVSLFGGGGARSVTPGTTAGYGSAQAEHLPLQRVDDDGHIRVPYAGRLRAAGHTPDELEAMIRKALLGMSQNPQVSVNIATSIANSVIVGGEVARPGRLVLATNRETVADAIALSGGYRGEAKDMSVRISRRGSDHEYRLSDVLSGSDRDMPVLPGDKIDVLLKPQTYSVLGAAGRVQQMPFPTSSLSLVEAVAAAGGANPQAGNAKAIFVFRLVRDDGDGNGGEGTLRPVVYHLNMMKPGAYFLSQQFAMRDKDVLYVGNAAANQSSKLVQLISQLFSPALSAAVVAQNAVN